MKSQPGGSAFPLKRRIALCLAIFFTIFTIAPSWTLAETITVKGGTIDVNTRDNTTNWNVTGHPVWNVRDFNVDRGSTYNIAGLGSGASLALLVGGGRATNILGTMNLSNLDFILQNIAGIHIGSTGLINLNNASLIASTLPLNLTATDFLARDYQFSGKGGFLMNEGKIIGHNADLVALIANAIENKGTIEVPMGTVALAAGDMVTIGLSGDGMISVGVDEATANTMGLKDQIKNSGKISANGGTVLLNAKAVDGLFDKAINIAAGSNATGVVVADDGKIEFVASGDITNRGTIQAVRGSIEIATPGDVETLGNLEAAYLHEKAAAFRIGGGYHVGMSYHDNLDDAITYAANASVSGSINDIANIIINAGVTLTLTELTMFTADSDKNGTGAFLMDPTAAIDGRGYNLFIKASQASTLGSIRNVGAFIRNESKAGSAPTFTSNPITTTWSNISDFRFSSTTKLKRFTGAGTSANPYIIYDVYGLQAMTGYLNSSFKLNNNIDAYSTAGWNAGSGFVPVGYTAADFYGLPVLTNPYKGTFNGNAKTVEGLYIYSRTTNPAYSNINYSVGLFGYTGAGSTVKNVGLFNVKIRGGGHFTGGLVGINGGTITDSYVYGSVAGIGYLSGVLAGANLGRITRCYSSGSVSGSGNESAAGGLVGINGRSRIFSGSVGLISDSYSTADVSGSGYSGGLVGANYDGSITNSYSTGNVSGNGYEAGGLVGWNAADTYGSKITNSYSTSRVSGSVWHIGGLVGTNSGTITNSYFTDGNHNNGLGTYEAGGAKAFYNLSHKVYGQSLASGTPWDSKSVWASSGQALPLLKLLLPTPITSVAVTVGAPVVTTITKLSTVIREIGTSLLTTITKTIVTTTKVTTTTVTTTRATSGGKPIVTTVSTSVVTTKVTPVVTTTSTPIVKNTGQSAGQLALQAKYDIINAYRRSFLGSDSTYAMS